jgi:hypothetical protein
MSTICPVCSRKRTFQRLRAYGYTLQFDYMPQRNGITRAIGAHATRCAHGIATGD